MESHIINKCEFPMPPLICGAADGIIMSAASFLVEKRKAGLTFREVDDNEYQSCVIF